MSPPYIGFPTFLRLPYAHEMPSAEWAIFGAPLDLGVTNRSGAREGPRSVRNASMNFYDGDHPFFGKKDVKAVDAGDIELIMGDIHESLKKIKNALIPFIDRDIKPILIGGEHTVTIAALRALRHGEEMPIGLIHFDAHCDLWQGDLGHGTVFRHAIAEKLIDPLHMVQVGLRSPYPSYVDEFRHRHGIAEIPMDRCFDIPSSQPVRIAQQIMERVRDKPCYLSIDVDCLDPAFAPGTGTPEAGGFSTRELMSILRELYAFKPNIVGMDIVEVSPAYDHAEITSLAAAQLLFDFLHGVSKRPEKA